MPSSILIVGGVLFICRITTARKLTLRTKSAHMMPSARNHVWVNI